MDRSIKYVFLHPVSLTLWNRWKDAFRKCAKTIPIGNFPASRPGGSAGRHRGRRRRAGSGAAWPGEARRTGSAGRQGGGVRRIAVPAVHHFAEESLSGGPAICRTGAGPRVTACADERCKRPGREDFFVRFRGVRGTVACPGAEYARYGATRPASKSAVRVTCSFWTQAPVCALQGRSWMLRGRRYRHSADPYAYRPHRGDAFLHPAVQDRQPVAHPCRPPVGQRSPSARRVFRLIEAPIFPVPLEAVGADISFEEFRAGDRLNLRPGVSILTAPLNHPNGATGYRIEWAGRSRRLCVDGRRLRRTGAAPAAQRRVPPERNPGCIPCPIQ